MKLGTKSVLFGAHCFFLHPWFVAVAWSRLFGFPFDPRLWVAFAVHDIGYFGKPNMDGEEGELHPFTGGKIMGWLFDADATLPSRTARIIGRLCDRIWGKQSQGCSWYCFSFYHSRFLSKRYGVKPSKLCIADKLAICLVPAWLYLPMANLTGEIHEYMKLSEQKEGKKYHTMRLATSNQRSWYLSMQAYVRKWVEEHKDGREDTWTPEQKQALNEHGVWK